MDPMRMMGLRAPARDTAPQIRNNLQAQARHLCQSAYRLSAQAGVTPEEVWQKIGELTGYLAIRKGLTPYVAADGCAGEITRAIRALKSALPASSNQVSESANDDIDSGTEHTPHE